MINRYPLGKKLNYVIDVFMDGCDWPLTAVAQSAAPAALHAALNWYCPDPVEIFTGWVRPGSPFKQRRGGSHGRGAHGDKHGNKFWRRFKKAFGFDPNEWLAKKMPMADEMEGRSVPGGAHYMWAAFNQIQRFQNFMFMYHVAEEFFYEWQSGIASTTYCQAQRAASFFGHSDMQGHFAPAGASACVINEVLKSRKVAFQGGNGFTPLVPRFQCGFSVGKVTRWDGDPDVTSCKLRINIEGYPPFIQALDGDGTKQMAYAISTTGGSVSFELEGPYSFWAEDVEFFCYGYADVPEIRPEGWCNDLAKKAINWATGESDE